MHKKEHTVAQQAVAKGAVAESVRWTRRQEAMFDDYFGRKFSYEGFTIEKTCGGYRVSPNPSASSVSVGTLMVRDAEAGIIVNRMLTKR